MPVVYAFIWLSAEIHVHNLLLQFCCYQLFSSTVVTLGYPATHNIHGGPSKVKTTTILLVTFECVGKIQ